jgi:hypothetical protein
VLVFGKISGKNILGSPFLIRPIKVHYKMNLIDFCFLYKFINDPHPILPLIVAVKL